MLLQTLSVKEAAVFLKAKPRTIRNWIKDGKLPAAKVGRFFVIPMDEVEKMVTPNKQRIENKVNERKAQAAKFREVLRGGGKVNKAAFLAERKAEAEFEQNCDADK